MQKNAGHAVQCLNIDYFGWGFLEILAAGVFGNFGDFGGWEFLGFLAVWSFWGFWQ